jgi:hypothetical protein
MRVALLLLVLANLVYFAWTQFFASQGSAERHLVEQQLNRDAIRLLGPAQVATLTVARKEPVKEPAKDNAKVLACVEWGAINAADAVKAEAALAALSLGVHAAEGRACGCAAEGRGTAPSRRAGFLHHSG